MAAIWDDAPIYEADQALGRERREDVRNEYQRKFLRFIQEFSHDSVFPYRIQLLQNLQVGHYYLEVDLEDVIAFDDDLATRLRTSPSDYVSLFEAAAREAALSSNYLPQDLQDGLDPIQVILASKLNPIAIRNLTPNMHMSRLVQVPGIVIRLRQPKFGSVARTIKTVYTRPGFSNLQLPNRCDSADGRDGVSNCEPDPYEVLLDRCKFADTQTLKLQETPETITNTSDMPRQILLSCDRYLCDRVVPGTRVTAVGIYTISQNPLGRTQKQTGAASVRPTYIRVLGLQVDTEGTRSNAKFTPEEEARFMKVAQMPNVQEVITNSIAPGIYGHNEIKRAIACLLFSGSRKRLPDGMRLRGDINVLLLGDPGTAKSQLLKFVESAAPIAVYTSGKGSSAAGLTASVVREASSREFYLEGGAMVLADGGVVCIDEFDKMHLNDRVAIHEAMEQQTISIAKAGITTILNSRTSVLAAANPAFGRYDDLRSPVENIEFQQTILSRFDLIFIIKDKHVREVDRAIADHVITLHTRGGRSTLSAQTSAKPHMEMSELKRYIAFARHRCAPVLSERASEALQNHYVTIREQMRGAEQRNDPKAVPITVRQLEAIVRLAEALAKMSLQPVATEEHVNDAIHLFRVSTLDAAHSGVTAAENLSAELLSEVNVVETLLKRKLAIGSTIAVAAVVADFTRQKFSDFVIRKTISIMVARDELEFRNQRKQIRRKR